MKYALLIYNAQDARDLPEGQLEALIDEYQELFQSPGVIDGQQLQLPGSATTVRVENADNLDVATALAARIPAARMGGAVEVRPLVERGALAR